MSVFQCDECGDREFLICKDCGGKGVTSDSVDKVTMLVCPACLGAGERPCPSCQEDTGYIPADLSEPGRWYKTITSDAGIH